MEAARSHESLDYDFLGNHFQDCNPSLVGTYDRLFAATGPADHANVWAVAAMRHSQSCCRRRRCIHHRSLFVAAIRCGRNRTGCVPKLGFEVV